MKINHTLGGALLIAGTTIGAGMLAVPVVTSFMGFGPSLLLLLFFWFFFITTAKFFIDVNVSIREESNLISMAGKTLGRWGQGATWVLYLLLLYSLTAAYISASAPLFQEAIFAITGWKPALYLAYFILPVCFGYFIYLGTEGVDALNRLLMLGLVAMYVLMIAFVPSHVQFPFLIEAHWSPTLLALPVVVTAFGYHIIIPTLSTYMNHNRKQLMQSVIWGSLITLIIYAIWQFLVMGVVSAPELAKSWHAGESAAEPLARLLKNPWVSKAVGFFSFFAILTSFLGVSLSLADFLRDGLSLKKSWEGKLIAICLTFLPPLIFVFKFERGFVLALEYAGAFVILLLGFLPAAMAWKLKLARYHHWKGKVLLGTFMIISIAVVIVDVLVQSGFVK